MHFLIPDTDECNNLSNGGPPYTVFNIHVNGTYHCSVRYSQLHSFNEQLKQEFGANVPPAFPPKRLLSLSPSQLEERRTALERYIQLVSQNFVINNSETFHKFLLAAQQESNSVQNESVQLEVCLMNGHRIPVTVTTTDNTDTVLEETASQINLDDDFVYYFGLYLVKKEENGDNAIVRKLKAYESPFISLKIANNMTTQRLVLRKAYWDPAYEDDLLGNRVAMNLLYVEAVSDVDRGWVECNEEQKLQLAELKRRGAKKDYLSLARTLKYYGYLQFLPCQIDYPESDSQAVIRTGNRDFTITITAAGETRIVTFRVTRMRCWRITTTVTKENEVKMATRCHNDPLPCRLELAFEYLVAKGMLRWITVTSDRAITMSMCLQEMVDELINKKNGGHIRRPTKRDKSHPPTTTNSASSDDMQGSQPSDDTRNNQHSASSAPTSPVKDLTSVKVVTKVTKHTQPTLTENNAFDGIGDDDL